MMTNERFDLVVKDELGIWNRGAEEEKIKPAVLLQMLSTSRQTPTMKTMESGSWNK